MTTMTSEMSALKSKLKTTWQSGDYGVFAKYLENGALEFFDRLNVTSGTRLLDIACGAGQLTIPAARRGIRATGLDLAANLIAQAKSRAATENLDIEFTEGDAEDLPYDDASFDVVMSLIGSMFAPRPELVASEMIRVCKPGGKIVMGNWTAEGFVGQMFKAIGKHTSPPAIPSPLLWGNEDVCRQRFGNGIQDLRVTRYMYTLEYPFSPAKVVDYFNDFYGPTNRAYASLNDTAKKQFHEDLTALWTANNQATGDGTKVSAEYIEVIAQR